MWLRDFGGPEALVPLETADPVAGPRQVLIDVAVAGVTFVETQVRAGAAPFPVDLPMIPGNGVGGVVLATGDQSGQHLLGRRVISTTGGSGGYAELVAVDASAPIEVPDPLGIEQAVAVLADGRTALMLMEVTNPRPGERVLIEAAAGGLGSLLLQLAKNAGAHVAALVGGPRKIEAVRRLGPDLAVDYRQPGWESRVRDEYGGIDVVFDGVGGAPARAAFELLAPGGRMVSYGRASGAWAAIADTEARARRVTLLQLPRPTPGEMRTFSERALADVVAGRLAPLIGQGFPLERAADAHAAIESRATIGKTLLDVGQGPAAEASLTSPGGLF